jgi:uncharacterized protein involved in exopolysaccharide biosynthesis
MMHEVIEKPRFAARVLEVVRNGLPSVGRYRRYFATMAAPIALVWLSTGAWIAFAPESFESHFTLILPGSGAGGSLNVESIGQAESAAVSAFSSSTLSPTENYKRLLMADVTLRDAAKGAGEDAAAFPEPDIKLVDQTNLISVQISGSSPEQAHRRAQALRQAFLDQLDRLRTDEAKMREQSDIRHMGELEAKVRETQRKLLAFQANNGLVSLDQFNSRISNIDALREREREARTIVRQREAQSASFGGSLGTGPRGANATLRLKSDPVFQKLVERYAMLDADAEQKSATLGEAHGDMAQADSERDTLRTAMTRRGRQLIGIGPSALMRMVDLSVSDGRSTLFEGMINNKVERDGARAGLAEIRGDLARQQRQSRRLVTQASQLADLTRDHRIAEAVFSTALARVDTNKQDPFASYPLVQTLEEPSLPRKPASPSLLLAVVGAFGATFLLLFGFLLTWFRQPILNKLLPKG